MPIYNNEIHNNESHRLMTPDHDMQMRLKLKTAKLTFPHMPPRRFTLQEERTKMGASYCVMFLRIAARGAAYEMFGRSLLLRVEKPRGGAVEKRRRRGMLWNVAGAPMPPGP